MGLMMICAGSPCAANYGKVLDRLLRSGPVVDAFPAGLRLLSRDVSTLNGDAGGDRARSNPRITSGCYSGVASGMSQPPAERRNRTSASSGSSPSR